MDSILQYWLRAELHNRRENEKLQSFLFDREFNLKYIGTTNQESTVYDRELDMYFKNTNMAYTYEIEVINREFILSGSLEKSTDFIRRVNYMYDWIRLQVNLKGKIVSVLNEKELNERWNKIKKSLLMDYTGEVVDAYLDNMDTRIGDSKILYSDIHRYFNLGLIFPSVPHSHRAGWQGNRLIEFSEYEGEKFEEQIVFQSEENKKRKYGINIRPREDSDTQLEQYEGTMVIPDNDIFPESALLEVIFRNDGIANQWYFKLERIK